MIKKLAKYIFLGGLALASFFPKNANAQTEIDYTPREVIGNPFSQHNTNHSQGDWNSLNSSEKISLLEQKLAEDGVSEINPMDARTYRWICADLAGQLSLNNDGIKKPDEYVNTNFPSGAGKFFSEDIGKHNIPLYIGLTKTINDVDHAIGMVYVGEGNSKEDLLTLSNWYLIDVYTDDRIYPGHDAINPNESISLSLPAYLKDKFIPDNYFHTFVSNIIKWNLQNGEVTNVTNKDYLIKDNPNNDKVNVSQLEEEVVNVGDHYSFDVSSLSAKGYNVNPNVSTENTPLTPEVNHEYAQVSVDPNGFFSDWEIATTGTISSGGVTNSGSATQSVKVRDTENPVIPYQGKIEVFQEDFINDPNNYLINATDNTAIVDSFKTLKIISEDDDKKVYEVWASATDLGGNVAEEKILDIDVLKAKVHIGNLEDIAVNYPGSTNPNSTGIPGHTKENTNVGVIYSYNDSDVTGLDENHPEINYEFTRTHIKTLENGLAADSSYQKITTADMENPEYESRPDNIILPIEKIEDGVTLEELGGGARGVTDNSGLVPTQTPTNLRKIDEDEVQANYLIDLNITDYFGNQTVISGIKATGTKSGIAISNLENLVLTSVDGIYPGLSPEQIDSIGEKGIPDVVTIGGEAYTLTHKDSEPTELATEKFPSGEPIEYGHDRTFIATGNESGKKDTTIHWIEYRDQLIPFYKSMPEDIILTESQPLDSTSTGVPIGIGDDSGLSVKKTLEFELVNENDQQKIYNALWTLEDWKGNKNILPPQKVTILKQGLILSQLEDILINFKQNQNTSPDSLGNIPTVTSQNINEYFLRFEDSEITPLTEYISPDGKPINYEFTRTWIVEGEGKSDTTEYKVHVKDMEAPTFTTPGNITITYDQPFDSTSIGSPTDIKDNAGLELKSLDFTRELINDQDSLKQYENTWAGEDKLGNIGYGIRPDGTVGPDTVTVDFTTDIEDDLIPKEYKLYQNYPNPFNPSTTIKYAIPNVETGHAPSVQLKVYDVLGKEVATLVNKEQNTGYYEVEFDANNFSSGIYYYQLRAGNLIQTKKMVLLR